MHIYSFRLWLVMIAIFTGVSTARAGGERCWLRGTRYKQVGDKVVVSDPPQKVCVEGRISYFSEKYRSKNHCRPSPEKGVMYSEGTDFFLDKDCTVTFYGILGPRAGSKILEPMKSALRVKPEGRQEQMESKGSSSRSKPLSNQPATGPGTFPNDGGTDPGTGGTKNTVPSN